MLQLKNFNEHVKLVTTCLNTMAALCIIPGGMIPFVATYSWDKNPPLIAEVFWFGIGLVCHLMAHVVTRRLR